MIKKAFLIILLLFAMTAAAYAQRLAVKVNIGNVRSGPGSNHKIIWEVEKYYPVVVLGSSGEWVKFSDFEKDQGWMHRSLLADIKTVITSRENCNIRSGPGTKYKIVMTVESGVPFKVLKTQGRWMKIKHKDGLTGWIHASLVW